ncbi:MAG: hypothetical protein ACOY3Z_00975 [Thermodesulfobacteriota bacterium]
MHPLLARKLAKNMQAMSHDRRIAYLGGLYHIWEWRRSMMAAQGGCPDETMGGTGEPTSIQ